MKISFEEYVKPAENSVGLRTPGCCTNKFLRKILVRDSFVALDVGSFRRDFFGCSELKSVIIGAHLALLLWRYVQNAVSCAIV